MTVSVKKNSGGVALVQLSGDIDMSTSPKVRDALLPLFKKGTKGIVVDLAGVSYMDSSGIATLIEGLQWSSKGGRKFILAGLSDKVMDVFVLTSLSDVFEFSTDPQGAFKDISAAV